MESRVRVRASDVVDDTRRVGADEPATKGRTSSLLPLMTGEGISCGLQFILY